MTSRLRIETELTGSYADATEADLHRLVMQLGPKARYVVLHRTSDELFAQAACTDQPAEFVVEYSLKSGKLRQTKAETHDEVYELLSGWAFDRPGWKRGRTWESMANDDVIDLGRNCDWSDTENECVVQFGLLAVKGRGSTRDAAFRALTDAIGDLTRDSADARKTWLKWAGAHIVKSSELRR